MRKKWIDRLRELTKDEKGLIAFVEWLLKEKEKQTVQKLKKDGSSFLRSVPQLE